MPTDAPDEPSTSGAPPGDDAVSNGARIGEAFSIAIVEHVAHPIFVKDRSFRFVLVNRAFCELIGHERAAIVGRTDFDFFAPSEAAFFRGKDIEVFTHGTQVEIPEEPITDRAGGRHVLATTKVPLRDATGEVRYLVGIIHDITRLKSAEDALRVANEELEHRVSERSAALAAAQQELLRKERLAVLGQLAGGLAHQIRNPLGAIMNAAYILRRKLGGHDDPEVVRAIAMLLEESQAANQTITDLLEYARIRPAMAQACSLPAIVALALARQAVPPEIRVELSLDELPLVAIDEAQMLGALGNLIRNAVEAMPQGGTLTLDARPDLARGVMRLFVRDTGPGLPPEPRARPFEPLVTTKQMGLGLGLATARALIDNQGGGIRYVSGPGEGACFELVLPLADTGGDASRAG